MGRPAKRSVLDFQALDKFRALGKSNWRTFIERKLHIITKKGELGTFGHFGFSPSQTRVLDKVEEFRKAQKRLWLLILKGRQRGVSTISEAIQFTDTYCGENTKCLVAAHLKPNTDDLVDKARIFYRYLPSAAQMPFSHSNEQEMKWLHNNGHIIIGTAGQLDVGHGRSLRRVHLSELSRFPDLQGFLKGFNAAVTDFWDTLVIGESTAYGADNPFCDLWEEAEKGKSQWTPLFLKWMDDADAVCAPFDTDLEQDARLEYCFAEFPELKDRMLHYEMSARQTVWYFERWLECGRDTQYCAQEYPCDPGEAFIASGSPFFPPQITQEYRLLTKPGRLYDPTIPFSSLISMQRAEDLRRDKDVYLEVWVPPVAGRKYIIPCDSSEGLQGRDPSSAFVLDAETGNMVAELHGIIDPADLCGMLVNLAKIYNGALIVPEAHGAGSALVAFLKQSGYWKLYYKRKPTNLGWVVTTEIGWDTNIGTRPFLFAKAKEIYRTRRGDREFIPSVSLIDEVRRFVIKDHTGRGAAAGKHHDDRVMAWAIGQMVCQQEAGGEGLIIKPSERDTIRHSGPANPDQVLDMIRSNDWTGQSFEEFHKREKKTW